MSADEEFQAIMDAQMEEWGVESALEKTEVSEWTLDKEGLALKACAVKKPTGTQYGLIIAQRAPEGHFADPRNLTRAQMQTVQDFIGAVLGDTEDEGH